MKKIYYLLSAIVLTFSALTLNAQTPQWMIGRWAAADDVTVIEFGQNAQIAVITEGKVEKVGTFKIDGSFLECTWQKDLDSGNEISLLVLGPNMIAYEGGNDLNKISSQTTAFNTASAIKGYEWLEGTWVANDGENWGKVIIGKSTYKVVSSNWNEKMSDINNVKALQISIARIYAEIFDRHMLALDANDYCIGIDTSRKQVYLNLGEYFTLYLKKIQ